MATILALDTSTSQITVGISKDGETLIDESQSARHQQSKILIGFIEACLKKCDRTLDEVDAFSVTTGPGSFTGVRTGLGTVKGFCFALNKPLIGIPTMEALVEPCTEYEIAVPLMEARRDFVYAAEFSYKNTSWSMSKDAQMIPVSEINDFSSSGIWLGPAVSKYRSELDSTRIGDSKYETICGTTLSTISQRKFAREEFVDALTVEPTYIQKTAAEGYV